MAKEHREHPAATSRLLRGEPSEPGVEGSRVREAVSRSCTRRAPTARATSAAYCELKVASGDRELDGSRNGRQRNRLRRCNARHQSSGGQLPDRQRVAQRKRRRGGKQVLTSDQFE